MSIAERVAEISRLSVEDRLRLVQAIWDTLADEGAGTELTDVGRTELRRRAAELDAHPEIALTWEEIKKSILEKP